MKLRRVYSNQPRIFGPIDLRNGLNIVLARVDRPRESDKDSHNLGKTLLIHLIDFLLLKGFDKGHFLYDHKELFSNFVFYLELETNSEKYLTIRREVLESTKISIQEHEQPDQDFTAQRIEDWTHSRLSFEKARAQLNSHLGISVIDPWSYRKGVGYFLRTQNDYRDVFQLGRFSRGRHQDWKPFMAKMLGFDPSPVEQKYKLDNEIEEKTGQRKIAEDLAHAQSGEYDKVKARLEIRLEEYASARARLDRFHFAKEELSLNEELLSESDSRISTISERLYVVDYERDQIRESLKHKVSFDIAKVKRLFQEAQAQLPDALCKSYEDLVEFNRRLTRDRGKRLKEQLALLESERLGLVAELEALDARRESILSILQESDSLERLRKLNIEVMQKSEEANRLRAQLEQLDKVSAIDKEIKDLRGRREAVIDEIHELVNAGNDTYREIRSEFNRIVSTIISVPAIIAISVNSDGNLEFEATILKSSNSTDVTSEDKGTSYRQLLCCAFDMALLSVYRKKGFFRFVYHDGVLEGLDNRKKLKLLEVIRELCSRGIQYILTVIEADLPRDSSDARIEFPTEEVVQVLSESGDQGRLFRMAKF
jgi:uncharacterized protein YydD (DUF2326 family)